MEKKLNKFLERLRKTRTEEEVKAVWAKYLGLDYDTSHDHDLYTKQVLFEFKFDKKLSNASQLAPVIAQLMYYLHRLKYHQSNQSIPLAWCAADRNGAVFGEVCDWTDIYSDDGTQFDWSLRPSNPDPKVVAAVRSHAAFRKVVVRDLAIPEEAAALAVDLEQRFSPQTAFQFGDKKLITEENFEGVYAYWDEIFGESVQNGFKPSQYFISDIHQGRSQFVADQGRVYFQVGPEEFRAKKIPEEDYRRFWSQYEKVREPEVIRGIFAKIDRLTENAARRAEGEFFTPLRFAARALEQLEKTLGQAWWRTGEYRLWDMAAGTGNLEYNLPAECWPYLYLSTLHSEDVVHLERLFPGVDVFQYDYLNDDIGNLFSGDDEQSGTHGFATQRGLDFSSSRTWKLPGRLREELDDPKIKWVVLINPPFATAQKGGAKGANKADVSRTNLRDQMHRHDLGEVSRELFAQFLYRIRREFLGKSAWLGLFSTLKYINSNNDQKLRDEIFRFKFERGFMFSSSNFSGTSSANAFPVGHLLWNLSEEVALEHQTIDVDVLDNEALKIGRKQLDSKHRDKFLSKWIDRPETTAIFPPFSSAITVKSSGPDVRDRVSRDFLGSLMCAGNDIQHSNSTALYSGPYASAGGHSITPENFEKAMVVHAVRRLPKAEWHNDRDQFMQPSLTVPEDFIVDSTVWNLFHNSNHTVGMRDVCYANTVYQVPNHFYPWCLELVRKWTVSDSDIAMQLPSASDRFVARWLAGRRLSAEASQLLELAKSVYVEFYRSLNLLRTPKYQISTWDVGWWQVRSSLKERSTAVGELEAVKAAHQRLANKLRPKLVELGFLPLGIREAMAEPAVD